MRINLDRNASWGVLPSVEESIAALREKLLNPSSIHGGGQISRLIIEESRAELRALLAVSDAARIVFCSGATEANNTAISHLFWRALKRSHFEPFEIVSSLGEHPSILEPIKRLERYGCKVHWLIPTQNGTLDLEELKCSLNKNTALVSIMLANNETGVVNPIATISSLVRERTSSAVFHCDGVQGLGKLPLHFSELGVDSLSVSGHKVGALSGIGALIVREDLGLEPLLLGGPQEQHFRAGTENVLGAASFGVAAKHLSTALEPHVSAMRRARDTLYEALVSSISGLVVHCESSDLLPNTLSVRIPGVLADDLVVTLDTLGVYVSSGAACASGKPDPSHVLLALGLSEQEARETIRISTGSEHSEKEIRSAADVIVSSINSMRR